MLLSSAYLAPVQYYTKLCSHAEVEVEQWDSYVKQTYRNRCIIAGADGVLPLTIPTVKSDQPKCLMKDVRISDHGNWRHLHWNALVAAYRHSSFFDYYEEDFRPFYEAKIPFLFDFNLRLCELVCRLIDLEPVLKPTADYQATAEEDYREAIHPKHNWTDDRHFCPQSYYQVFQPKTAFLPNLSVVDLLFNMGPESLLVLKNSYQL